LRWIHACSDPGTQPVPCSSISCVLRPRSHNE
jgi:hypothetical protein